MIVQTPGLGPKVFFTAPLSLFQWFLCILAGLGSLACYQLVLFLPLCSKAEEISIKAGNRNRNMMSNQVEKVGQPLLKLRSSGRQKSTISGQESTSERSYSLKEDRVREVRGSGV